MPFPPGELYTEGQTSNKTSQNEQRGAGGSTANITVNGPITCSSLKVPTLTTTAKFTATPARIPQQKAYSGFVFPTTGTTSFLSAFPSRIPIVNVVNPTGWDPGSNLIAVPEKGWYCLAITSNGDVNITSNIAIAYRIKNTFTLEQSGRQNHEVGIALDSVYARSRFKLQFYVKCTSPSQDRWEIQCSTSSTTITSYTMECVVFCLNQAQ